jgi:hypothetical protein
LTNAADRQIHTVRRAGDALRDLEVLGGLCDAVGVNPVLVGECVRVDSRAEALLRERTVEFLERRPCVGDGKDVLFEGNSLGPSWMTSRPRGHAGRAATC